MSMVLLNNPAFKRARWYARMSSGRIFPIFLSPKNSLSGFSRLEAPLRDVPWTFPQKSIISLTERKASEFSICSGRLESWHYMPLASAFVDANSRAMASEYA